MIGGELLRKEVIQPQVPLRLPCYDFTPITNRTLGTCLPAPTLPTTPRDNTSNQVIGKVGAGLAQQLLVQPAFVV